MTCQWHQGRLPRCTHHHRCLHNLFITPNWNSVPIKLFTPSSPCPEQLPFCSVAVNLTVLGPSYNSFPFMAGLLHLVSWFQDSSMLPRMWEWPPTPLLLESHQVGLALSVILLPLSTSVYKCHHTRNAIPFQVRTIFCCLYPPYSCVCLAWFFSSVFDIYLWCWGLNPGSHTCLGMYSATGAPPSAVPFVFILRDTALNTGTRMSESPLSELLALQVEVELLDPKRFHLKCFQ